MLGDEVGNQLDATALGDIEALNQGESDGRRLNLAGHLGAQALDELMWNHEDENVGILGGLDDIGNGNLRNTKLDRMSTSVVLRSSGSHPSDSKIFSCLRSFSSRDHARGYLVNAAINTLELEANARRLGFTFEGATFAVISAKAIKVIDFAHIYSLSVNSGLSTRVEARRVDGGNN